jgi:hypothetical protein
LDHLQQRFQHRRQAGVFVAYHAQGFVVHVGSPMFWQGAWRMAHAEIGHYPKRVTGMA